MPGTGDRGVGVRAGVDEDSDNLGTAGKIPRPVGDDMQQRARPCLGVPDPGTG